ncbi:MAG: type II toxin-antitoxin system VapC family toxin [Opitutaceae bacterium]|nr:type II toxin-antitoxin system VapC family toxin [Opitutaceae bacterium]
MKAVFDTNILVDHLNGIPAAAVAFAGYPEKIISRITWLEVLTGCTPADEATVRAFLSGFRLAEISDPISEAALVVRRGPKKIRLPDALILATARVENCDLVTRNTRDFPATTARVVVPYSIPAPSAPPTRRLFPPTP